MSRRRTPRKRVSGTAPKDGTPLDYLSDAELVEELARRRVARGELNLDAIEGFVEGAQSQIGEEALAATIAALPPEGSGAKPCPKCGKPVPVKTHNRIRHVLTTVGELRLARNYHYCRQCRLGFYPRDRELSLPEEGEVSNAMERRILDFGVNDTFESAAERWSIHYPTTISSNLVRRVVDRVGRRCEAAESELTLQQACRPSSEEPARSLVVAGDGSMLLTREESWKEAKVAVVARGEDIIEEKNRRSVSDARYVAVLGGKEEFGASLKAALQAERADEVTKVVWLGDGAPENWTMATELCPLAIQVLDIQHAIQNGMECGKVLLGEPNECVPLWERRIRQLLDTPSLDAAIRELVECLPETTSEVEIAALDRLVGYYRNNEARMRYAYFRELGLPIGSGIVESAHRHVLQVRMKRAGQRWALRRAKRMARLRAAYRTAGPRRFHSAIREALKAASSMPDFSPVTYARWRDRRRRASN
jgi:hypothetical protein